jgi:hypothetical protein
MQMEASLMGIPGRYRTLFLCDNLFILIHFYREIVKNTGRNPKYISTSKVYEDAEGYVYCIFAGKSRL